MPFTTYVIVGQERTGSDLLLVLLASHPNVLSSGEIFNPNPETRKLSISRARPIKDDEDPLDYLATQVYANIPQQIRAVGFKLFYYHARHDAWSRVWDYLKETRTSIIHLKRKNLLDRYLSHQLAIRSDKWIAGRSEKATQYERITLDPEECIRDFGRTVFNEREIDTFFEYNPRITIAYEDLCVDQARICTTVQEFLGLRIHALTTRTKKQRTQKKSELIANYDELKKTLATWISRGWAQQEWMEFFDEA